MNNAERLIKVQQLVKAIYDTDSTDAVVVMGVILEEWRVGAPLVAFEDDEDEASSWAALATFEELRAYFIAAGRRLAKYPLGQKGTARLAQRMLAELAPEDRVAVLLELNDMDTAGRA
ncbi:hypothetical protein SAMN05421538_11262 [Paracoccus isoporae]|uniref:Uncharacterized protein n=1 Tax=Paracoccus isoporae TaxID=591205 RepID=A0A1G7G5M5_9RHOB|nr:hypothetical protein [Paracoccus isoporae]SDE83418.1 hypothetical protein SAMN05421538_11262 [Paracoccus isoporae]